MTSELVPGRAIREIQMALKTSHVAIAWNAVSELEDALALALFVVDEPRLSGQRALTRPPIP